MVLGNGSLKFWAKIGQIPDLWAKKLRRNGNAIYRMLLKQASRRMSCFALLLYFNIGGKKYMGIIGMLARQCYI